MSDINSERFDCDWKDDEIGMKHDYREDGDYVLAEYAIKLQARIDELEADLIRYRERSEKVTKQCITLNTRIDELEADKPISLKFKDNGQVWIAFDAGGGRQAMISLNNIVLKMHDEGITRGIVLDAIARNSGEHVCDFKPALDLQTLEGWTECSCGKKTKTRSAIHQNQRRAGMNAL
jgi:hypothetical protein